MRARVVFLVCCWIAFAAFAMLARCSHAQSVPRACYAYQRTMQREVAARLGPAASPAPFAAQMAQESSCNPDASSPVGAQGLAQFMPETADWIGDLDSTLAPARPTNPNWAIRALVVYDVWLMHRNPGKTQCDTYAFALVSYNGGEGWLHRDQIYATKLGVDHTVWFGQVELTPDPRRSKAAIRENRGYPERILHVLLPAFVTAGWGQSLDCS
jgi:soluble lytic murein transglycosylase-like protein